MNDDDIDPCIEQIGNVISHICTTHGVDLGAIAGLFGCEGFQTPTAELVLNQLFALVGHLSSQGKS